MHNLLSHKYSPVSLVIAVSALYFFISLSSTVGGIVRPICLAVMSWRLSSGLRVFDKHSSVIDRFDLIHQPRSRSPF